MIPLPLFHKKAPAVIVLLCLFVLFLLTLLTQDAQTNTTLRTEKYDLADTLSQVGYKTDYQGNLDDMKQAYAQLSSLGEYYEISMQFLYLPDFPFSDHFLYLYEEGYSEDSKVLVNLDGIPTSLSAVKTIQLSGNCMDLFPRKVQEGRLLTEKEDDALYEAGTTLPILVGSEYADLLQVGDLVDGLYIQKALSLEVVGVLAPNSYLSFRGQPLSLDRYLIMPSFRCAAPTGDADELFQVRHYANKLSGYFPQEKAPQILPVITDLNRLEIGTFSFSTGNALSGIYSHLMSSIGLSTHTLNLIFIAAVMLLFPLFLLYLLHRNFSYLACCFLSGISIRTLQLRTIFSCLILLFVPVLSLYGYALLVGLALRPASIVLVLFLVLLSLAILFRTVSTKSMLLWLGRDSHD